MENFKQLGITDGMSQHEILARLARKMPVESYLEVGVRDGATLWTVIEAACESLRLVACCDTWSDAHGGTDRGSHDHIDRLLSAVLYYYREGQVVWLDGDSAETLPALLASEPDRRFDLVHIDGDHSEGHALVDMKNGWNLTGRILVAHDTNYSAVKNAWEEFVLGAEGLACCQRNLTGRGTGVAVRA